MGLTLSTLVQQILVFFFNRTKAENWLMESSTALTIVQIV